jgi:membrane associated rhomboid family serine protease
VGSHCVECVRAARPPAAERIRRWDAGQPVLVAKALIGVNLLLAVIGLAWSPSGGLLTGGRGELMREFGLFGPAVDAGEWYRIITSGFLHFGVLHLAMNMYFIWVISRMVEPATGHLRYLGLYLTALVWGSAGALLLDPRALTAGASGAAFGLIAAALVGFHLRGMPMWRSDLFGLLVINLVITFTIPGISVGGHVGGLLGGAAAGLVVLRPTRGPRAGWEYAALVGLFVVGFLACLEFAARSVG